jgi:hypothetical protein
VLPLQLGSDFRNPSRDDWDPLENESLGRVVGGQQIEKRKFDQDSVGDAKTAGELIVEYSWRIFRCHVRSLDSDLGRSGDGKSFFPDCTRI